jgi:hypothetical protein
MERAITTLRENLVAGGLVALLVGLCLLRARALDRKASRGDGEGALTVTSGNLEAGSRAADPTRSACSRAR